LSAVLALAPNEGAGVIVVGGVGVAVVEVNDVGVAVVEVNDVGVAVVPLSDVGVAVVDVLSELRRKNTKVDGPFETKVFDIKLVSISVGTVNTTDMLTSPQSSP